MIRFFLIPIFLIFLIVGGSSADEVSSSIEVSKSSVQVAEPFDVEIRVRAPHGTRLSFPQVSDRIGEFDVLSHQDSFDIPSPDDSKQRNWVRRLTLETIETGQLTIPAMEISVSSTSRLQELIRTEPYSIQVASVLENRPDPMSFRDIKNAIDVEEPTTVSYAWLGWLATGVGATILTGLAIAVFAKRKKWITPIDWARTELQLLRQFDGTHPKNAGLIFSRLETIIRTFLDSEFDLPAKTLPKNSLLFQLAEAGVPESDRLRLKELLQQSELAKYAGRTANELQLTDSIDRAESVLENIATSASVSRRSANRELASTTKGMV